MKRNFLKKILAPWGVVLFSAALWAGDTAIVDGQNAEDVVGQTDAGGNAVFTDGSPYDSQRLEGFNIPYDVEVDTVSHRLFVCDYSSSRIMVYDLDSSNALVDRTADRVLGQSGFYRNLSGTNASGLNFPTGIDFHAGSNLLYVGDQANHRVVIYDVASITDGENAVNVLGQGNFTSASAATTLSGMRNPNDCVYDGVNKRLFVSDTYNYRILVFDLSTVTDGENAVNVLGQDNFTTNSSTASIKGFNTPRHVDYDPTNSRLFVADYNNNRVLVFDVSSVTDGENAVNVLGQSDFSSSGSARAINRFTNPFGVVYATATQRLYVGDSWSQRVTIFDVASITDGENAVNVLGQSDFTSSTNRTTQDGMYIPRGLTIDEGASRVFVTDQYNNRVTMFDVSTTTIVNGQNAQNVVGQTDGAGTGVYTTDSTYDGMVQKGIDRTYDVVVDTVSHRLFVADHNSHRVLVYNLNAGNIMEDRTADNVLGQPDFLKAYEISATQSSVVNPSGLSFDSSRGYLFVTSYFRSRVLIFDVNSITNGENAINVLGQSNFTAGGYVTSQAGLRYPYGLDYDGGTQRLFVSDRNNHRVMVYDLATITNGENAVNVLGQSDFTTNTLVTPPTAASLNYPHDVEVVGNQLYVADEYNNRVTVFDVMSITDGENAINVLGQTNFTSNGSGASQSALNHPKSFAMDTQLNRLFVSDYNNHRVLVFDVAAITDGENAANVLGQLNFTGNSAAASQSRMYAPTGLSYDSGMNRLYVAEYFNHRVLIHSVGPVAPSTSTVAAVGGGDQVRLTWNSAGDDGTVNNLTGNYRIQYATYTASWSTSTTPTNATTVTVATTSAVPGSAQGYTVNGLTIGTTYYFVLWTADEVPNWSEISNTTSAVPTGWFDPTQIEVDGPGGGLDYSGVAWGDYDNDGDMDILTNGYTGTTRELRIYKNNGNGTMDAAQIEVDSAGGGLASGGVAWGDYDNDGDLDILVAGTPGSSKQLRIYKNNGNGTMDAAQIEVEGLNGGLDSSGVAWGDYDNDGDMDILVCGYTGTTRELRIYKNNGNGTIDPTQIEVDGPNGGNTGKIAWGDFDNDGDMDILTVGSGSGYLLNVYKNNGNGSFNPTQISLYGRASAFVAWGDYDNDADLDILVNGDRSGKYLNIYNNNGNGTFNTTGVVVDSGDGGVSHNGVAWGDHDNDGDLDLLVGGEDGASGRQLRVYKNNGNGTIDAAQMEVDGVGGGLMYGDLAWGDFDNDGDLDILASGQQTSGSTRELRIYKNQSATANTAPTSPGTLVSYWDYTASGISTATFKWAPGADSGTGATPANVLTYQVEISTMSNFTGKSVVPGQWATPGMGNYLKPPQIYDGNTNHGVGLRYLPFTNTTYYYRVKTIDAGLKESAWSATGSLYTLVASSVPSVVTDLVASSVTTNGQLFLTWTAPLNINSGGSAAYDVRYRTSGPITTDGEFNGATSATGEPTPGSPGAGQTMGVTGLAPGTTYYFAIKSSNDNGTSGLDVSSPRPSAMARDFDSTQIEVDGAGGGLNQGDVVWGDYDNDGDLDVLVSGLDGASARQLRIYKNNGNSTMDSAEVDVDVAASGLYEGGLAWGDYDNDGDLDVLANGRSAQELRIYKNNGNGTMDAAQIEVDASGGGLRLGDVAWGDFDNDGDLDIITSGYTGTTRELRIYKNNGNGTIDATQIEVDGANGGLTESAVAWGDYDNDGDLDVMTSGHTGTTRELRIYTNNGNGALDATQIEVDSPGGGLTEGGLAWGDFDNDGDLDILASGYVNGIAESLRIYKNNGNGTMDATQIDVDGAGGGTEEGDAAWGDYDNDGDLDVLISGRLNGIRELRVYKNNGNGTLNSTQIEVDGSGGGLRYSRVAWGDYDSDGDLDVLANGDDWAALRQLRIYKSYISLAQTNTTPSAPGGHSASFSFNPGSVSVASFTWAAGTDSGAGATVENGLTYDLQISTTSNFSKLMFPGQLGASPRMGSYLKPPKIFNSNTYYGVVLKSTDPWNAQTTASYGLRTDTTYYYRVKTVDSALAESAWSGSGTVNTGVGPSTSTIASAAGGGEVTLNWSSAGDDGMIGNLTGTYRIQYATYTASWSTSTTPTNATTVTIATTTQTPASAQANLVTGLTGGLTYYFVLWTGDEVPNWSTISNTTSAVALADLVVPSTSTLAATSGNPEEVTLTWNSAGDDGGSGNLTGNYRIQYATYTVAWSTSSTPTDATTVTIATTTQTPGSAQSHTITSLLSGVTYYFVLWSQDESNNWSGISNTTSTVGGYWFDPNQIDVDGAGGGLYNSDVAWGDFDNDGDLDVLASGRQSSGNTKELRIYKNNGNGTIDAAQIEVDGAGGGLYWGGVAWGDYDSDGDLDVLACGSDSASARQLRIYINNGNGTMNATQIEVDGTGGGVTLGDVAWGDYDNDGDLDTVMIGSRVTYELRVYKNNGNGTMDPTQIEVDGPAGGLESYSVAWGDYDNDGDLDILANGWGGSGAELRIYKNNGNGTMDAAQIDVDGPGGGVQTGSVAWGDYDNDGDLDVLTNGYAGGTPQLRIYKNNGNGTMDDVQIEVDGAGGGLVEGAVVWGDYDVDGDLDLLTNGYVLQLRVYKNNGNGTMDPDQMDLDGAGGGLSYGSSAWGDYDNDGDLDVLVSGSDGSSVSQLRIYKNLSETANTAPTSPGTLTSVWDYNVLGTSTATFKWAPGSDSGIGATPANALTYQLEISTMINFTGNSVVPGQWSSPGMGNYLKPPKIYDGNTNHGVRLRYLPFTNTTYYYRVKTVDAGLKESAWSATGTLYNLVTSSVASVVTDLVASSVTTSGQVLLTWTAPDSINSGGSPAYDVRYRTSGAITTDGEFNGATAATGEPTPGNPGTWESMGISGLAPGVTYYFAIKSSNVNGTSPLDISIPRPSAVARDFDVTPIEVDGAGGGLNASDVAWGDYDSDGDLDILTGGYTGTTRELRIYKNNGNGTINATQIEVDGAGGGVRYSSLAWGDYDNDGDLDILVSGQQTTGTTRELRIYKNNGNGTINATQIEVDGAAGGLAEGAVAWGDYDNDGDLDIIASGSTSTTRELRIYKNNGNGTMNTTQIEVDGAAGGLDYSSVAWGDYDNDGDLDVLGCGSTASAKELRIYKNNGNGTMNATQIDVDGAGGGLDNSGVAWGDYDNDGDLDILASGYTGTTRELRIYKNNGNGTLDAAQIEVDGAAGGVRYGRVTWGDYDNDGDLDILSSGQQTSGNTIELRVYKNNGNATMDPTQLDVGGAGKGLYWSGVAWGDYDSDGDLDVLANGDDSAAAKQLRIYNSYLSLAQPNTTPAAPGTLSGSFSFNSGSISVASFTWAAGTDSGAGATVENGLTYDLQISTTSNFSKLMFPGQLGASPRMGSYLKPPKIFNSNTYYGVVLKSTDPWNAQTTASYGLRTDTTYYYRVKTVDSALAESGWSTSGSAYTGVTPSTSTLAAASTATDGEVLLTWDSPGDDVMNGNLTGTYRIQYATFTASWSSSSTPTDATTVTIATTTQGPGSSQSKLITGLTGGLTYYFVLWTGDEVPNWSTISNSTSAVPFVSIRSVTIEGLSTLGFGVVNLGSQVVASTGVVIRNDGTLVNKYVLSASTQTVGSPWNVKDSTPAGPDAMVIFGLFDDDTAPVLGNFGTEDLIGTMETGSNSSVFSIDGSTTGASVPAGEARKIWIRLDMPTTSRTEAPQTMRIQITAQPP